MADEEKALRVEENAGGSQRKSFVVEEGVVNADLLGRWTSIMCGHEPGMWKTLHV